MSLVDKISTPSSNKSSSKQSASNKSSSNKSSSNKSSSSEPSSKITSALSCHPIKSLCGIDKSVTSLDTIFNTDKLSNYRLNNSCTLCAISNFGASNYIISEMKKLLRKNYITTCKGIPIFKDVSEEDWETIINNDSLPEDLKKQINSCVDYISTQEPGTLVGTHSIKGIGADEVNKIFKEDYELRINLPIIDPEYINQAKEPYPIQAYYLNHRLLNIWNLNIDSQEYTLSDLYRRIEMRKLLNPDILKQDIVNLIELVKWISDKILCNDSCTIASYIHGNISAHMFNIAKINQELYILDKYQIINEAPLEQLLSEHLQIVHASKPITNIKFFITKTQVEQLNNLFNTEFKSKLQNLKSKFNNELKSNVELLIKIQPNQNPPNYYGNLKTNLPNFRHDSIRDIPTEIDNRKSDRIIKYDKDYKDILENWAKKINIHPRILPHHPEWKKFQARLAKYQKLVAEHKQSTLEYNKKQSLQDLYDTRVNQKVDGAIRTEEKTQKKTQKKIQKKQDAATILQRAQRKQKSSQKSSGGKQKNKKIKTKKQKNKKIKKQKTKKQKTKKKKQMKKTTKKTQ